MRLNWALANPAQSCPDLGRLPLCLEALLILGAGSVGPFHIEKEEEEISIRLRKIFSMLNRRKKFPPAGSAQAKTQTEQRTGSVFRDM